MVSKNLAHYLYTSISLYKSPVTGMTEQPDHLVDTKAMRSTAAANQPNLGPDQPAPMLLPVPHTLGWPSS